MAKAAEVVLQLTAQNSKYLSKLRESTVAYDRSMAAIRRSAGAAEGYLKTAVAGFFAGLSVRAAQELIDSAIRIQNALKIAGLSGTELTKVYDRLFESAQRNAAPLEALATLYGRAAQQQKELGVSTEQLLTFTDNVSLALRVAGTDASTASGALLQLGQALGSGTVHAEEFNSILEGVPTIAQAAARGITEANGSVAALKQLVVAGKVSSRAFFDGFAAGADTLAEKAARAGLTTSQGFTVLTNSLVRAAERFDTSTEASKRFGEALHTLSLYVDQLQFDSMLQGLDAVAEKMNSMMVTIENWGAAFGKATGSENFGRWLSSTRVGQALGVQSTTALRDRMSGDVPQANSVIQAWAQRTYGGNVTTPKTGRLPATSPTNQVSINDPAYAPVGAKKKSGSRGAKKTADDRFAESIQDIRDRTSALNEEQATLGSTFFEQQKRSVALDLEQEALRQVREEARRKGAVDWENAKLSPEQVKQIDQVSEAYARQADELRKAQEAQDLQRDVLKGAFSDLRSALDDGKLDWDDLSNVALNALDKIIDKIDNDLIDSILQVNSTGSSGGGIFGALLSGLGGLLGGSSGGGIPWSQDIFRAGGGPVKAGQPYIVGDKNGLQNAELFVPGADGMILPSIPNIKSVSASSGGSGPNITYAPVIDARGADAAAVARLEKVLQQDHATFKGRVVEAVSDARRRSVNI